MCGIVAAVARQNIVPILMGGLKTLEYRGYDSAGIALMQEQGLLRLRAVGKVRELEALVERENASSRLGIAHTRWATHGLPSMRNAHPIASRDVVAVVHNGIIENHEELRHLLADKGFEFASDTDTEVIAHLIEDFQSEGQDLVSAVQSATVLLRGAYAIGVISRREPDTVVGARHGSPLVIGTAGDEQFLASDVQALLPVTREFIYLQEGDVAELKLGRCRIFNQGKPVTRPLKRTSMSADAVQRGEYRHYMLKEIHEQGQAIADTLEGRIGHGGILTGIFGPEAPVLFKRARAVHLIACGSSYHACLVAKYWIEQLARIPANVEIASEYRYRDPVVPADTLFVCVSQSGETADTLAALKMAKQLGYLGELAICNVPESSLVRESALTLLTRAGPEIGVASTKAFTTQLVSLAMFALELARQHGVDPGRYGDLVRQLESLPQLIAEALRLDQDIMRLAAAFADKQHALFLGRGAQFPIAMEGALKLKEISYIHAEAYPAGELKHGPLALVDRDMPIVAVAPSDKLLEKLKSNIAEVRARGGQLFVFADGAIAQSLTRENEHLIALPSVPEFIAPIVFTVPLQLLAYHVAILKGTDVDQPRNLAKSVTVE